MTLVSLVLVWCLGIWFATSTGHPIILWTGGALSGTLTTFLFWQRERLRLTAACLAAFCLGGALAASAVNNINVSQPAFSGNEPKVILTGLIAEEPQLHDRHIEVRLDVESMARAGDPPQPARGTVLVMAPRYPVLAYGMRLRVAGSLQTADESNGDGYGSYLARQGIYRIMAFPQLQVLEERAGHSVYHTIIALKNRAQATIQELLPDPEGALLSGILLGDDSGLPDSLEEAFQTTGMTHIIAISGFNIALLAGVLLRGGRTLVGHRAAAGVAFTGIVLYTILVGADAAVVRAAIMGSLYIFANRLLGRPIFAPAVLMAAAFVMSLVHPFVLWDVGFQLSFAATLGLMLFAQPMSDWSRTRLERWLNHRWVARIMPLLSETILVTVAAQLLTLPLLAYHFGRISLASLPANLLILPAQPGVMIWGGLSTIVGMIAPSAGQLLAWVAWVFLAYTTFLVRLLAQLPLATVAVNAGLPAITIFYALIFAGIWLVQQNADQRQRFFAGVRARAAHGALVGLLLLAPLTWHWLQTQPDGRLHVSFLDVGQGDAIFVQTPSGRQLLVDGGEFPATLNAHLGRQMPFGDRHLDVVVATHPDDDHVAGLPGVFDRYRVNTLLTNGSEPGASRAYEALLQAAREDNVQVRHAQAGEVLRVGDGVRLTVLHPGATPLATDNDNSISLRLAYRDFSLLLTGDAEMAGERAILNRGLPMQALVLKAGHHGSRTSSNDFFLQAVRPRIVVVSAGRDNELGHPHPEMLQRAAQAGATVLRTDELGTIEMVTDGERMWWEAAR